MSPNLHRLLAEARWLESLAREIVGDRALAEDIVQDVWVASLQDPSREIRDPRSWLATALRNALRREKRSSSARRHREASIARPERLDATDVVARAEAQRLLVESVLGLDEPWRSTVLWHYYDGLSCADIARRERLSDSTVRNRLARALELLRERLYRSGTGGGGLSAIALLIPAHGVPPVAGGPIHFASTGSIVGGGLLMTLAVKVAAVLVASACIAWWLWPASTPIENASLDHGEARDTHEPALAQGGSTTKRESLSEPISSPETNTTTKEHPALVAAADEPPLPSDVVEGIVYEDDTACTRGGTVELLRGNMGEFPDEPDVTRMLTTSLLPDGTFRFTGYDFLGGTIRARVNGGITLYALHYGMSGLRQPGPHRGPGWRIALKFGSASLSGHAWDEEGRPLVHARVSLSLVNRRAQKKGTDELDMQSYASTNEAGAYEIQHLSEGRAMGMLTFEKPEGLHEKQHFGLDIEHGHAHTLDFGVPHPWPTWTGVLRNRAGSVIRGVNSVILRDPAGTSSYRAIPTDKEGHFRTRIVAGQYGVWVLLPERDEETVVGTLDAEDHDFEHDLTVPGTSVTGRVSFPDGSPVDGAKYHYTVGCRLVGRMDPSAARGGEMFSDGRFSVDGLEPGTYRLTTYPVPLSGGSEGLEVIVRAEDFEIVRDLILVSR